MYEVSALPLAPVNDYINRKYNYTRLCLYNLITYHSYVQSYIEEYEMYLKKVEREFPIISTILEEKEIQTLPAIAQNAKVLIKNKKFGQIYIIGKEATRDYRKVVDLCKQMYRYDKQIKEYQRYVERCIISLSKSITDFKKSYEVHLSMVLERETFGETILTRENFGKIVIKYKATHH